jgi:hypothetical protein
MQHDARSACWRGCWRHGGAHENEGRRRQGGPAARLQWVRRCLTPNVISQVIANRFYLGES